MNTSSTLRKNKGFTLMEVLLVIGLSLVIGTFSTATSLLFVKNQNHNEVVDSVISLLRQAQFQAQFQKNNNPFGVKFLQSSYVMFEGDDYDSRIVTQDVLVNLSTNIVFSGMNEVVFSSLVGAPVATGTIMITSDVASTSVTIAENGLIHI